MKNRGVSFSSASEVVADASARRPSPTRARVVHLSIDVPSYRTTRAVTVDARRVARRSSTRRVLVSLALSPSQGGPPRHPRLGSPRRFERAVDGDVERSPKHATVRMGPVVPSGSRRIGRSRRHPRRPAPKARPTLRNRLARASIYVVRARPRRRVRIRLVRRAPRRVRIQTRIVAQYTSRAATMRRRAPYIRRVVRARTGRRGYRERSRSRIRLARYSAREPTTRASGYRGLWYHLGRRYLPRRRAHARRYSKSRAGGAEVRARSGDSLRAGRRIVPTRSRRISIALREPRRGGERDASRRAETLLRRRYERASRVAVRAGTRRRLRRPRESSLFRRSVSIRLRPTFLVLSRNSLVPPKRARRGVRSGPGRGFGSRRVVHSPPGSGSGSVRRRSASRTLVEEASPTVLHRVEFRASTRFFRATKFRGVRAFHRARVDGRTTGGDGTGVGGESRGERRVHPSTRFVDWRFRRRIVGDGGGERRRGEECVRTPGTGTGMGTGMIRVPDVLRPRL